jgi:hypothetical protein
MKSGVLWGEVEDRGSEVYQHVYGGVPTFAG